MNIRTKLIQYGGNNNADASGLKTFKPIPKIIWSYWHDDNPPLVVQRCFKNWKKHNPNYEIHLLSQRTLGEYLKDIPENLSSLIVQKQADWIRLALLKKYGGIWSDASIFFTESLDWINAIQESNNANFIAFYIDRFTKNNDFPVIENWFLAAPMGSSFINNWYELFTREVVFGETVDYIEKLKREGRFLDLKQGIDAPVYLTMHVAAQDVLQSCSDKIEKEYLYLQCAEDTAYKIHVLSKWRRKEMYVRLLLLKAPKEKPSLIKLRGKERLRLEKYLKNNFFTKFSLVANELKFND